MPNERKLNMIFKKWIMKNNEFLKKNFGGHKFFLWGHWYPCFGLLVTSALSFKAGVDVLCSFSLVWSSDLPLVWYLLMFRGQHVAKPFQSMYLQKCPQALEEVQGSNPQPSVWWVQCCKPLGHSSSAKKNNERQSLPCRSWVVLPPCTYMLFDILPGSWLTYILKGWSSLALQHT